MTILTTREWLEDMRRFAGRDATRATELLDRLDEVDDLTAMLDAWGEKCGADPDEVRTKLDEHEALVALLENDPLASELGAADDQAEHLKAVLAKANDDDAFRFAVQDLLIDAGLLEPTDYTTDPLPLLRMFLPV